MTRTRITPELLMRRMALFLAAAACATLLAGCGQDIVEPLTTPDEAKTQKGTVKVTKETAPGAGKRSAPPRRSAPAPVATPAPARTPAEPTPTPGGTGLSDFTGPVVIEPWMMVADNGTSDSEGGWCLSSNGLINLQNIALTAPLREVSVQLKGQAADDVWPQVDLVFYNRTTQQYYYPLKEFFVTTAEYHEHRIPLNPPLPAGTYQIALRYYNNEAPGTKGDRNVFIRRIVLSPVVAPDAEPVVVEYSQEQ